MQAYLIAALIFALLIAAFAIQNTMMVTVHFLIWQAEISLVLVILGSLAAGALLLFFIGLFKQYSNHRQKKDLKTQNKRLEKEVADLTKQVEALVSQNNPAAAIQSMAQPIEQTVSQEPTALNPNSAIQTQDQSKDPFHVS
ncbi:MAG TPA: hypothetical protein DIT32_04575 [Peptococcaceae bacterium]|nr:hypothetical protein [Peptococcaceae bacterium]